MVIIVIVDCWAGNNIQVQYLSSIDENRPLGIETDEVQKFLFYWDQVFLYGLKSAKNGYWNFVSAFSHPSLVNEVTYIFLSLSLSLSFSLSFPFFLS